MYVLCTTCFNERSHYRSRLTCMVSYPPKFRRRWDLSDHPEIVESRRPFYDVVRTSCRRPWGRWNRWCMPSGWASKTDADTTAGRRRIYSPARSVLDCYIIFSTCPFVRLLPNTWTQYFEKKEWTDLMPVGTSGPHNNLLGVRRSKVKVTRGWR